MGWARLILCVATLAWTWLALSGWGVIAGIRAQHAPGYPNAGQLHYYVVLPALAAAGCAILFVAALLARRPGCPLALVGAAALAALLPYLLFYTGGM